MNNHLEYKDKIFTPRTGRAPHTGRKRTPSRKEKHPIRFWGCTAAMSLFFLASSSGILAHAGSNREYGRPVFKYYTSVMVRTGDTLHTIAEENMGEQYPSADVYVHEVMRMNSLPDETIHAGRYLIIPYYSSEQKL